jgi:hypothetical protein
MTESVDQQSTRFADMLEKNAAYTPVRHHKPPMWDLTRVEGGMPAQLRGVVSVAHIPIMSWGAKDPAQEVPEGTALVEVDANGAYVAAATSGTFAHCAPEHTGPLDLSSGQIPGGYMLVDAHQWQLGCPGSPLGSNRPRVDANGRVWVAHTVYAVLRDLVHGASWTPGGHWPDATVYDSWTADVCRFDKWGGVVRDTRAAAKVGGDTAKGGRVKIAYSQAVQMWATEPDPKGTPVDKRKKNNKAYRPDWYAALRGQHFANMFRRAYECAMLGSAPLKVWATDRMMFEEHHLMALLGREVKPFPMRLDETGLQLGTFKRVRQPNGSTRWYAGIEDM